MSRRAADLVIAAGLWTALIWVVRFSNMIGEDHGTGFLVVHGVIAGVSLAFAAALLAIGWRARRTSDAEGRVPSGGLAGDRGP